MKIVVLLLFVAIQPIVASSLCSSYHPVRTIGQVSVAGMKIGLNYKRKFVIVVFNNRKQLARVRRNPQVMQPVCGNLCSDTLVISNGKKSLRIASMQFSQVAGATLVCQAMGAGIALPLSAIMGFTCFPRAN